MLRESRAPAEFGLQSPRGQVPCAARVTPTFGTTDLYRLRQILGTSAGSCALNGRCRAIFVRIGIVAGAHLAYRGSAGPVYGRETAGAYVMSLTWVPVSTSRRSGSPASENKSSPVTWKSRRTCS